MAIFYQDLLKFDEMAPPAEPSTPNPPTVAHPILDRSRDVVMMTADEPMFPDPNAPKYSTQDLAEELKRHGVEFELTKGKYNNKDETSVIAYDMPSDLAHQLAKKYMQESYVHIEPNGKAKLKYANGAERDNPDDTSLPLIPLEGKFRDEVGTPKVSDSQPQNNFTYIPSINKYVSLDFDWGKLPSQLPSFKGEPTMKNEFSIDEVKAEIAKVLKKYQNEYESTLIELRKADKGHKGQLPHNETEEREIKHIAASYEKKGKSPEQSKAIAYATVNAEHAHKKAESCDKCGKSECVCKSSCKKCGSLMTKADMCAKCGEVSAGTKKNEAVSFMDKKGDKSAKGPQETPDKTKEAYEASGAGGEIKKGKLGKAEEDLKMLMQIEELEKAGFLGKLGAAAGLAAALGGAPKIAEAAPNKPLPVSRHYNQVPSDSYRENMRNILVNKMMDGMEKDSVHTSDLKQMGIDPKHFWEKVSEHRHTPFVANFLDGVADMEHVAGASNPNLNRPGSEPSHLRWRLLNTMVKGNKGSLGTDSRVMGTPEEHSKKFQEWSDSVGLKKGPKMSLTQALGFARPEGIDAPYGGVKKSEEDLKTLLGLELLFKASEESSEETSSPERSSHEETPADEESKTKKSVHNIKAESSFSSEKSLVPRTAGDKAPEHSASASPKSHQPSRLGKLISAAKKAISNSAAPVGAGRIAMTGAIPNFGSLHDPHMNKK